jgi:OmpA-OmpF porin, OOP family
LGALAGAIGALAMPSVGHAAPRADGVYLRGEAGLSLPLAMNASGTAGPNFTASPDMGPIVGGAVGLRLSPIRIELGLDFMRHDAGSLHFTSDGGLGVAAGTGNLSGRTVSAGGTVHNVPVMANLYYDFDTGTPLEVYLGIGVGLSDLSLHDVSTAGARLFDGSDLVFAYQPMIGVDYALNDRLSIGLQYRYFATTAASFHDTAGHAFSVASASHNILATITYSFATPTPPPASAAPASAAPATPAAAAVAPPPTPPKPEPHRARREFLVFFDFDKATLTASGRRVIDDAVLAYRHDKSNTIVIRGFTDAVGSAAYNLELSRNRAMAVYRYMIEKKVAPGDMGVDWQGKEGLRVLTEQREPQNRRVEIEM